MPGNENASASGDNRCLDNLEVVEEVGNGRGAGCGGHCGYSTSPSGHQAGNSGPWNWSQRAVPPSSSSQEYRHYIQNPDRLMQSHRLSHDHDDMQRSQINMSSRLPQWMWYLVMLVLGIGERKNKKRLLFATFLHVMTLSTGMFFGSCGMFFNFFDMKSDFTKTTVIIAVTKSILGLLWIGLGVYSNSLAARLFSNSRMADCIRLHSKTFMKVSTVFIVTVLCVGVLATDFYSNAYLLDTEYSANNTQVLHANCATLGLQIILCQVYFASKVSYGILCMLWNLMVAAIFLSVCRTHTIGIRRFRKELMYDTKIYEEFCLLQAIERSTKTVSKHLCEDENLEPWTLWDDDISDKDEIPPHNAQVLRTLRYMRQNSQNRNEHMHFNEHYEASYNFVASELSTEVHTNDRPAQCPASAHDQDIEIIDSSNIVKESEKETSVLMSDVNTCIEKDSVSNCPRVRKRRALTEGGTPQKSASCYNIRELGTMPPPIMTNEDLMFTYFMMIRRLSSTSRILQRWMLSLITLVMFWCGLFIVNWMKYTAQMVDIVLFLMPLLLLGLLTSAYAEVNFEGDRVMKCLLPTEKRMPVIYYFQNTQLELKIFSFTMSYNVILTVLAGIALTFGTRIILDQFSMK